MTGTIVGVLDITIRSFATSTSRGCPGGFGDAGFIMGGSTSLLTVPGRGLVVAIATNTSFADTAAMALQIAQAVAGHAKSPAPR